MICVSAPWRFSPRKKRPRGALFLYSSFYEVTGERAQTFTMGCGTYARHFPNAASFGPEHPERPMPDFAGSIHGVDEAACIDWLLEALKIYIATLLRLQEVDF